MNIYVWKIDDGVSIDGISIVVLAHNEEEALALFRATEDGWVIKEGSWRVNKDLIPAPKVIPLDKATVIEFNYGGIE